MKILCQRNVLAAGVQAVGGVVPTRTPKDVLKNIKLHVDKQQATLIATDQEVGMRYTLAEVDSPSSGEVLLPLQKLSAILRESPDDVVSIEATGEALFIRSGHSEFRLSLIDPAEFPDVPTFGEGSYRTLAGDTFQRGIQRTIFSADVESTRYALGGVLLDFHGDSLTLAATDSRRLAVCRIPCSAAGEGEAGIPQPVVPSKAMAMIERNVGGDDTEVKIAVRSNDVIVASGPVTIYSRLVQGRFPKYEDVIPRSFETTVELVAGPFFSAVRQAMIVTNEESRGVDFAFDDGTLVLTSQAADVGVSRVEMPIAYSGPALKVTFDPRFVADFLKVLEPTAPLTLNMNDPNSAAVYKAEDTYQYVVMPLAPER